MNSFFEPFGLLFVFFLSTKTQYSEFWFMGVGARKYGTKQLTYNRLNIFKAKNFIKSSFIK